MTISLWTEASRDLESEQHQLAVFAAKQQVADLWPFLALAQSEEEFGHRLAMVADSVLDRVPDSTLHEAVLEGFRENFHSVAGVISDLADPKGDLKGLFGGDGSSDSKSSDEGGDSKESDDGDHDEDDSPSTTASLRPTQFWHAASRRWITVVADGPGNPAYFSGGPEEGPNTGQTGSYPVEVGGPDPWNPINGNTPLPPTNVIPPANRFPAEPQPWTVPPDKMWVDRPMQLGQQRQSNFYAPPRPGWESCGWCGDDYEKMDPEYHTPEHCDASPHGEHEPAYAVAVQSNRKRGSFSDEPAANAPDANPDYFGQGSQGLASDPTVGYPEDVSLPEPDERVEMYQNAVSTVAARSNVGACATCNRPVFRTGRHWDHLESHMRDDHNVMLDADHPWVQQQQARRAKLAKPRQAKAASHGFFLDPRVAEVNAPQLAGAVPTGGGAPSASPAPKPPPSMSQGGPGAEAMPPLKAKPNSGANTPQGPASAPKTSRLDPRVAMFFHAEDLVRARPSEQSPTGVPDEYMANTFEGPLTTRPRQSPEERGVNTPQRPGQPIPQISSGNVPQGHQQDDDEDEDEG